MAGSLENRRDLRGSHENCWIYRHARPYPRSHCREYNLGPPYNHGPGTLSRTLKACGIERPGSSHGSSGIIKVCSKNEGQFLIKRNQFEVHLRHSPENMADLACRALAEMSGRQFVELIETFGPVQVERFGGLHCFSPRRKASAL